MLPSLWQVRADFLVSLWSDKVLSQLRPPSLELQLAPGLNSLYIFFYPGSLKTPGWSCPCCPWVLILLRWLFGKSRIRTRKASTPLSSHYQTYSWLLNHTKAKSLFKVFWKCQGQSPRLWQELCLPLCYTPAVKNFSFQDDPGIHFRLSPLPSRSPLLSHSYEGKGGNIKWSFWYLTTHMSS